MIQQSYLLLGMKPKEGKSVTFMFIAAQFITAKIKDQAKCPRTNK